MEKENKESLNGSIRSLMPKQLRIPRNILKKVRTGVEWRIYQKEHSYLFCKINMVVTDINSSGIELRS